MSRRAEHSADLSDSGSESRSVVAVEAARSNIWKTVRSLIGSEDVLKPIEILDEVLTGVGLSHDDVGGKSVSSEEFNSQEPITTGNYRQSGAYVESCWSGHYMVVTDR